MKEHGFGADETDVVTRMLQMVNLVIFNDAIATSKGVDFTLMRAIHRSVLNACNGFYVEYQPIVTANTGKVVGAEALIRWAKEPYGVVPPGLLLNVWKQNHACMIWEILF